MKKLLRILILGLISLGMAAGCTQEAEELRPSGAKLPEGAKVTLTFVVEADGEAAVKAQSLGEDTPLDNLYLAVFGGSGYLKEYVKTQDLEQVADTTYVDREGYERTVPRYQFKATLSLTENRRIIHFIGNGPSTLSFGYADAVMPPLLSQNGARAYWQMKTVNGIRAKRAESEYADSNGRLVSVGDYIDKDDCRIVDGRGYVPDAATAKAFRGIPLVRNWAKISLTCDADSYFTPRSFAVVNVPSKGAVAPHSAATGFIADYQLYSFEQLREMGYSANLPQGPTFDTTIPSHEDFVNCTNGVARAEEGAAVYLYERPVPTTKIPPSSVIVYGDYDNPSDQEHKGTYYYKVDLMEGDEYYPVFRNFQYQIKIIKILSQGHHNPAAAAAAAGSADVSADINASHLADISDGVARLIIDPWMAHTYTGKEEDGMLQVFFVDDVSDWNVNMNAADVTVEKLPMALGEDDVITSLSIDPPIDDIAGSIGWRRVHFVTDDPSSAVRSQTIRVTARHSLGRLYRDVVITLLPNQPLIVRCAKNKIAAVKGTQQTVEIAIPEGLAESMFPLLLDIEPERNTLTPDDTKANNNLPVQLGKSFSEDPAYSGKDTFYFVRTLSWDEYRRLPTERDEDDNTWRVLSCYFKSNCDISATAVWVRNEYFVPAHTSFLNSLDKTFRNLRFTSSIPRMEGESLTVRFTVDKEIDWASPEDFPMVTLYCSGMEPSSDILEPVSGYDGTYIFRPEGAEVELSFYTTTQDGDLLLELSADDYEMQTLRSHYFRDFGFVDGHKLWRTNAWSNVACGYVNSVKNKTLLFGYHDDPEAPNATVSATDLDRIIALTPSAYPYTPEGPRSTDGDQTYHELEFKTDPNNASYNPVSFKLSAPGYVEEEIVAKRFQGNIFTQDKISTSTVFKPDNTYGFSVDTPSFTISQEATANPANVTVSFDSITELRSADPKGVLLGAGGTYILTVTSLTPAQYKMFYVQINVNVNKWEGVTRVLAPLSGVPSVGEFYLYPGANNQYIWNLPAGTSSATLTLTADPDYPISIKEMILKSYRATFYN